MIDPISTKAVKCEALRADLRPSKPLPRVIGRPFLAPEDGSFGR